MNTQPPRRLALWMIGSLLLSASPLRAQDDHPSPRARRDEPARPPGGPRPMRPPRDAAQRYSLQQAMSERAQLHTIAFSGLAFLTGDFAADTFLPPGKVSDYFGFQYLRDSDAASGGHSPAFLTRIAFNMLAVLTPGQRAELVALAREQQAEVRRFALMRLPLMQAFRQDLLGQLPKGSTGLDRAAVRQHSAELYEIDGRIAWRRAEVMARLLRELGGAQHERLAQLKFGDSRSWPEVGEPAERRELPHDIDVAVMTYASEMFAWQAGSLDADTYFCPERHAMYFGGFGLKTAPALGKQDYAISTALTGDAGADFLAVLDARQRERITALPALQRPQLEEIARLRRLIAGELRRFLAGERPVQSQVLRWSRRYGELDGDLAWLYAQAFSAVGQSLSDAQRTELQALRDSAPHDAQDPKGPFLYADPLDAADLEQALQTAPLFGLGRTR